MRAPSSVAWVLLLPVTALPASLRIDLPVRTVARGGVLVARCIVIDGEVASASASFAEQKIDLRLDGGALPILFAVPLDAEPPLSLTLQVRLVSGEELEATEALSVSPLVLTTMRPAAAWTVAIDPALDVAREERELTALVSGISATRRWSKDFAAPARAPVRAAFGIARGGDGAGVESPRHLGVDFAMRRGASVRAPARGVVRAVRIWPILGETIVLDHGAGVASVLGHLDIALVEEGETVEAGAVVAWAGASGTSDGVLLHYGLYVNGLAVAPSSLDRLPHWLRGPPPESPAVSDANEPIEPSSTPTPAPAAGAIAPSPVASPATIAPATPTPVQPPEATPSVAARAVLGRLIMEPASVTSESFASALEAALRTVFPGETIAIAPGPPRVAGGASDLVVTIAQGGAIPLRDAAEATLLLVGHLAPASLPARSQVIVVHAATGARIPVLVADARAFYAARRSGRLPDRPDEGH